MLLLLKSNLKVIEGKPKIIYRHPTYYYPIIVPLFYSYAYSSYEKIHTFRRPCSSGVTTIISYSNNNDDRTTTSIRLRRSSACPDPGQCICNAATGVMTDHAMPPPFNRINNGCTEQGSF